MILRAPTEARPSPARAARGILRFVHDERVREIVYQALVFGTIAWVIYLLLSTAAEKQAAQGILTGFGFLDVSAGFDIDFKLIDYEPGEGTYGDIFIIGILNTLLVSVFAIIASTALAFVIGIMRLSSNWLVSRIALVYVEFLRNTPLLIQVVFWYLGVFNVLPRVAQSLNVFDLDLAYVNNRGMFMATPIFGELFWVTQAALAVAVIGFWVLWRRAARHQAETGGYIPVFWPSAMLIIGLPALAFMATGQPLDWERPVLGGFNYRGGVHVPPAFLALVVSLSLYHAAHLAESIRAGIQSVPKGLSEAARSLGLHPLRALSLVVIPLGMRAIVPPMISSWISAIKNTSLAAAIGYADLVAVFQGTSINQSGHAVEIVAMTMGFFMAVSLVLSALLNLYNKHMKLKE
ncbi:MAG: ABC transporter permease subunit [Alphaproteobacteria bacterium]